MKQKGLSGRRQYSAEFKARVVALCHNADSSVAEIARAHAVDVNLLRRWLRQPVSAVPHLPPGLVPIRLESPATRLAADALQLDIRTGDIQIQVHCPAAAADACAHLLRAWLS